ncbi:MAG: retroviral-like aspartic protease family protein [Nitrospinota bacterium]|nr:retroviral-like aspartic protease family protein [Nitrospinota bacterium]
MARQAQKLTLLMTALWLATAQAPLAQESYSSRLGARGWSFSTEVVLNGAETAEMVIDSGSSFTIISTSVAKKMGLGELSRAPRYPLSAAGGIVWVRLVVIDSVQVAGAMAHGVEGAVADLPSFKGAGGLLGKSFLDRFAWRIDGKAKSMELSAPQDEPLFGGRGQGWWRSNASRLARQAGLFRAMELGVEQSVHMGDSLDKPSMEKLSKTDAAMLASYYGRLLEVLRKEAEELRAPDEWVR